MYYYEIRRVYFDGSDTICERAYKIQTELSKGGVEIYFPSPDWIVTPVPIMPLEEAIKDAKSKGWLK